MEALQKIIVLCLIFGAGVLVGMQFYNPVITQPGFISEEPVGPDDGGTVDEPVCCDTPDVPPATIPDEPVACTMDAKICPDGSAVGRIGPDCEFAACPSEEPNVNDADSETVVCTPESKQVAACYELYAPVCGLVAVQCITAPCDPVPQTFSNDCFACAQDNVISYTHGACEIE